MILVSCIFYFLLMMSLVMSSVTSLNMKYFAISMFAVDYLIGLLPIFF